MPAGFLNAVSFDTQVLLNEQVVQFLNTPVDEGAPSFTYEPLTGEVAFLQAGLYDVTYGLSITETGEFAAYLDGVVIPTTVYAPDVGGAGEPPADLTVTEFLVRVTAGQVLTIRARGASSTIAPPSANDFTAYLIVKRLQ